VRVAELWRYPVKSMRGEALDRAEVREDGIVGDRLLRVEDERGLVTARRKQRLVGVTAEIGADGEPLIDGEPWHSPGAAARVHDLVGHEGRLIRTDEGKRFDAAPILVCTDGALAAHGADRRRFRPNVVVAGVEGLAEREWVGGELRIGEVILDVVDVCERCGIVTIDPDTIAIDPEVLRRANEDFGGIVGVLCTIARGGTIAVADEVVAGRGS
jgi:uncharacterized protein